jgi:hypothetical protein
MGSSCLRVHKNKVGWGPIRRFEAIAAGATVDGTPIKGTRLLNEMYQRILTEIIPDEDPSDNGTRTLLRHVLLFGEILLN